jgi:hypothetical protein
MIHPASNNRGDWKIAGSGLGNALRQRRGPASAGASTSAKDDVEPLRGLRNARDLPIRHAQARGEAASPQADIWAFGVVLYELLTGASPFGRPTTADTLASVLGSQPDYSVLPSDTPANVRHLVRRCLEKDRKRRLQHMGDVRIEVEDAQVALTAEAVRVAIAPAASSRTPVLRRNAWKFAVATGALAIVAFIFWSRRPLHEPVVQMGQIGDESTGAVRRGDLPAALSLAERGLALAQSQRSSLWEWTFRLLRAESLVFQSKPTDALADLTEPVPAAGEFDSLRARQQFLYAKTQLAEGKLQQALNTVEHGRRMASSHDVHFDLDEFAAQLRLRLGQRAEGEALLRAMVGEAADVGDRYHQALALNDIGMGQLARHRTEEALPWLRRSCR